MRLLDTSNLSLRMFNAQIPPYAILSHCWGPEEEEVSYQQLTAGSYDDHSSGWRKIEHCCQKAAEHGLKWAWVDTCCIDKASSSELSESINSMFSWYKRAAVCYVFLEDLNAEHSMKLPDIKVFDKAGRWKQGMAVTEIEAVETFAGRRWFVRGWTLQELLAPHCVLFYNREWTLIGDRKALAAILSLATSIDTLYLNQDLDLRFASIAQRMSWASRRTTTRVEDMAYSLLGLFGVNMPLLYGEGSKAFTRLQLEILKQTDDESLFAWGFIHEPPPGHGILADSPRDFKGSELVQRSPSMKDLHRSPWTVTRYGLEVVIPGRKLLHQYDQESVLLNCELIPGLDSSETWSSTPTLELDGTDRCWKRTSIVRGRSGYMGACPKLLFETISGDRRLVLMLSDQLSDISALPGESRGSGCMYVLVWIGRHVRACFSIGLLMYCFVMSFLLDHPSPMVFWSLATLAWRLGYSSDLVLLCFACLGLLVQYIASSGRIDRM